jgi:hypothetical protein
VAWVWAARQDPVRPVAVRRLAGALFLGGVGRLLSMLVHGQPRWFQIPRTVVELVVPPVLVGLAEAVSRAPGRSPRAQLGAGR